MDTCAFTGFAGASNNMTITAHKVRHIFGIVGRFLCMDKEVLIINKWIFGL